MVLRMGALDGLRADAGQGGPAGHAGDSPAGQYRDAEFRRPGKQCLRRRGALVQQHGNVHAGLPEREGGGIGAVVVGGDRRCLARPDAVTVAVGCGGGGEHHPRPVIARKEQGALHRAGGQDDTARPDPPQSFRDPVRIRITLHRGQQVVVVVAGDQRPAQPEDVRPGIQPCGGLPGPGFPIAAIDRARQVQQVSAGALAVVHQHDAEIRPGRGQRGGQSGGPRSDDEQIAVVVAAFVVPLVPGNRIVAEARETADDAGIFLPRAPHEGLVVEPGGE